jgi:hypothetical protein
MLRQYEAVLAAAAGRGGALEALRLLPSVRARLDAAELTLIEGARESGVSWARIAAALGLSSRQAAEQRYLRLHGDDGDEGRDAAEARSSRERQRKVDTPYGEEVARLRTAARSARRRLAADPDWDGRHPRAALVRDTIALAGTAAPGPMFALLHLAVADLRTIAPDVATLPAELRRMIEAVDAADAAARDRADSY